MSRLDEAVECVEICDEIVRQSEIHGRFLNLVLPYILIPEELRSKRLEAGLRA